MPLIKSKSKRAFEQNVETEMKAHPEASKRAQNLAIAYSVKRKAQAKKKMAEGGAISAKDERRPMPKARHDDAAMVARNDNMKPLKDSSWTDTPTERQAMAKNSKRVVPIKRPKMVPTDAFSVKLYDDETGQADEKFQKANNLMAKTSSQVDFLIISQTITALCVDLSKIASDFRFMASGPHGGIGEIILPELQKGSSIMPGKVNPVIPETVNQLYYLVSGNNLSIESIK